MPKRRKMLDSLKGNAERARVENTIAELAAALGNRLITSSAVCSEHCNGKSWVPAQAPDAVVFPQSAEDIQTIVRICGRHATPVIPFGAGTSFEGQVNAPLGGVSVNLADMNRILEVHPEDLDCVVEPGVKVEQLNQHLREHGLFFSVDPGAN